MLSLLAELIFSNLEGVVGAHLSTSIVIFVTSGRFAIDHVDVGVQVVVVDVDDGPTGHAKKRVDAKIPPDGSSRSTYARVGEICFAPIYRTQIGACGVRWRGSQFDHAIDKKRMVNNLRWNMPVLHQTVTICG